jgi:hypothetical protein
MAIKGKSKSRSRRVVAVPPKPPVYIRKKPLFRRPWFVIVVVALVVAGTLTGVLIALGNNSEERLQQRTIDAVTTFATQVERKFPPPPDSQAVPPTGYVIYPALLADLDAVLQGKQKVNGEDFDGEAKGKSLQESAKASADAIRAINVVKVIPLEAEVTEASGARGPGGTRLVMVEAQFLIGQAFALYQNVGDLMEQAAKLPRDERKPLIDEAKDVAAQAQALFSRGYQKITNIRSALQSVELNPFQPGNL